MTDSIKCEVCGGHGDYPIIDSFGTERYCIRCPECFGAGWVEVDELPEEPPEWPPRSTAAKVQTKEALALAVKDWNER